MKTIAIVGATGAVGQQMLKCLEERNIQCNLKLLASARSKGKNSNSSIKKLFVKN
ncbi:Aspartate-semialdehyde dehydrogenase [Faecalitalea cylindroides T2-87]|uniref:Aspartate-semialdehyde dehydrogenase n=1 Tax=Faecalitalea cylindroides T2-87 TaxID=717960 RepID=D4JG47_9FIRM|nr:Aspartate-semialdehyde dehydrogenase [Faecalitalea cylindroides T2-87]